MTLATGANTLAHVPLPSSLSLLKGDFAGMAFLHIGMG